MARVISILNIKGGVGKSTISFNLAHAIQRNNKRVLLVDLDMQCNLTDMCVLSPSVSHIDLLCSNFEDFLPTSGLQDCGRVWTSYRLVAVVWIEQVINPLTNQKLNADVTQQASGRIA